MRSYIHIAEPSALAILRDTTPSLVSIGIMNGSTLTRCGALLAQPLALVQRLVHQANLALLQVAQAAVHELGALDEVPEAKSSRSTSAVRRPRVAASRATPAPVIPPPITNDVE